MKSLYTLVFALSTLAIPLASYAQSSDNVLSQSATRSQTAIAQPSNMLQQSTPYNAPQQSSVGNPVTTYGAPMTGSSEAGRKWPANNGSLIFQHH